MGSFLLQPYPFSDNIRQKVFVCAGIGLFVMFFLAVFAPFGIDELPAGLKWVHATAFGGVSFLVACFFQAVLPRVFPALFREEGWKSWKEILYLLLTTISVGIGNYVLIVFLYPQNLVLANFFRAQLITLEVGIFPILFVVFMKQLVMYRRYAAEAQKASDGIVAAEAEKEEPGATPVTTLLLRGDNQKEELLLSAADLFFMASADNYVKVRFRQGGQLKQATLRASLKKLEDQLAVHRQFFRCHRMYLVNLDLVESVSGNAQGLKLHLLGLNEAIPVSRSLTETVRERLYGLSHSPQNV